MRIFACLCLAIALIPTTGHSIAFTNQAAQAGVDDPGDGRGAVFADYDGDGWPDLLVSRLRGQSALLYRNLGDGRFALQPDALEDSEESLGATFIDLEADGDLDIFLLKHNDPNRFFRNEGGHYVPMATPNGIRDAAQATGALFGDFDADGNLDLFTTHRLLTRNRLFSAILTDHASDITEFTSTLQGGGETVGAVALDYDGDGVRDLYVANSPGQNLLYLNRADGTFQQLTEAVGLQQPSTTLGTIIADYDNDGDADLYLLNAPSDLSTSNQLYENRDGKLFVDVAPAMGLSRSIRSVAGAWADLDNDGDLDLVVSDQSTVTVWRNDGDRFSDVTANAYGSDAAAPGEKPVGLAIADYDRDGDVDLFASGNAVADALLRNDTTSSGHWLHVELVGRDGHNSPVGSTLHAHVDDAGLELTRDYTIGTSLTTAHGDLLHLGTGGADQISELIIEWPSGSRQVLTNLPTDQVLKIEEPRPRRDLAITRIVEPNLASSWGSGLRTEVEITNVGQVPVADALLHVTIVVDGEQVMHTSVEVPELAAGETMRVGEDSAWHPRVSARHRVQFELKVNDDVAANDRRARSVLMHRFDEVAQQVGVDEPGQGFAGAFADYDNDGDLDLYLANGGQSGDAANVLYRNTDGRYEVVTEMAGIADVGNGTGVLFADFDRDGYLDLFAARGGFVREGEQNHLFHNDGDGTFSDISVASGLDEVKASYGVTAGDYDRDGHLDLFVSHVRGQLSTLYRNTGDGHFEDVTEEKGIFHPAIGGGSASAFVDYDNDGDLDLYAAIFGGFDLIYSDVGRSFFAFSTLDDRGGATGLSVGDFEEDGNLDVFVVNFDGLGLLWRNDLARGRFVNVAPGSGVENQAIGSAAAFGDYDNDGDLDLFVVNVGFANRAYVNRGDGTFIDRATAFGMANRDTSRGLVLGDYDNDGNLDVYVINDGAPNQLFKNGGSQHSWLSVKLRGVESNADGIGARVTTHASSGEVQMRAVRAAGEFSAPSLIAQFGLNDAAHLDSVVVTWPNGGVDTYADVSANVRLELIEGKALTAVEDEGAPLPLQFALGSNFPNPFNATTTIGFSVPDEGAVRLVIHNSVGQIVRVLVDGQLAAGQHTVQWHGHDDDGHAAASGVYFASLAAGSEEDRESMILIR